MVAVGMVVVVTAVVTVDMADMGMGGMGTEEAFSTIAAAASTEARRTTRRAGNIAVDEEVGFATDLLPHRPHRWCAPRATAPRRAAASCHVGAQLSAVRNARRSSHG
jgi:hypothetical protein